ncbi:hypothetical protein AXFE_33240 [Acidithrix ferrooxidans]|uniref:Uncharacterized protein n=1 Tax=Acidithrix ferrooxidans TaxID=1280514 RepID=A0A0D8HFN2_9ACTN|nr:hypothetical protein AXFE_33240 [Acidithrix ferrooxidans]
MNTVSLNQQTIIDRKNLYTKYLKAVQKCDCTKLEVGSSRTHSQLQSFTVAATAAIQPPGPISNQTAPRFLHRRGCAHHWIGKQASESRFSQISSPSTSKLNAPKRWSQLGDTNQISKIPANSRDDLVVYSIARDFSKKKPPTPSASL